MVLLGAHLSTTGGWWRAVAAAAAAGCDALQIFLRAPGRWARRTPTAPEVASFLTHSQQAGLVGRCFAHAPYVLNLASSDPVLRQRSVAVLGEELRWGEALGLQGLVVHPGSAGLGNRGEAEARCLDALAEALGQAGPAAPQLLLENTAGAGGQIGRSPHELARLIPAGFGARVGLCLDTAHLWAAGHDLRGEGWDRVLAELAQAVGRAGPELLHGNDSMADLGSHHDRHASPGEGALGAPFYCRLLHEERLDGTPLIVEIPPGILNRNVVRALRRLRRWAREPVTQ